MASDALTPFLGLTKPVVNDEAGEDLWGEKWNRNADILDVYAQTAGGVSEAPLDGVAYARRMNAWTATLTDVEIADAITAGIGTVNWLNLPGKPSTFPPSAHVHPISDVTGLQTALDGKPDDAPATGLYYIRAGSAGQPGTQQWYNLLTNGSIQWSNVVGKPTTFPPGAHTHPTSDITNLDTKQASQDAAINTKIGDAPNDGSQYARQSAGWSKVTGGAIISDTAPVGALPNSFWWKSDSGALFINYQDVDTTQFVQVNAAGMPEAPKDAKPYARRDGAWFDLTATLNAYIDQTELTAQLGAYLPLTGGNISGALAVQGQISSGTVITVTASGGNHGVLAIGSGSGGGVLGYPQGQAIYGALSYAGYGLYTPFQIYSGQQITGGAAMVIAGLFTTTAGGSDVQTSSANVVMTTNGTIRRTTSSIRYKSAVEVLEEDWADKVLDLVPVYYRPAGTSDPEGYTRFGFISEQAYETDPRFALCEPWTLIGYGEVEHTNPDGTTFMAQGDPIYEDKTDIINVDLNGIVAALQHVIKRQNARIAALEAALGV